MITRIKTSKRHECALSVEAISTDRATNTNSILVEIWN